MVRYIRNLEQIQWRRGKVTNNFQFHLLKCSHQICSDNEAYTRRENPKCPVPLIEQILPSNSTFTSETLIQVIGKNFNRNAKEHYIYKLHLFQVNEYTERLKINYTIYYIHDWFQPLIRYYLTFPEEPPFFSSTSSIEINREWLKGGVWTRGYGSNFLICYSWGLFT